MPDKTFFDQLEIGTVLRNRGSGITYVVISTGKGPTMGADAQHFVAARCVTITNPSEWEILRAQP